MPELPEVEVVRRSLNELIPGLKINKVSIYDRNLRYKISKQFKKAIQGQKVLSAIRRGKFLLIELKNKNFILIHLGMTGKMLIQIIYFVIQLLFMVIKNLKAKPCIKKF